MQLLKDMIIQKGANLGGGILKVDGFINHQVDPILMDACGQELANRFSHVGATKVLTAEISGIAPAVMAAKYLGIPVVYARKSKTRHYAGYGLPDHCAIAYQRPSGGV